MIQGCQIASFMQPFFLSYLQAHSLGAVKAKPLLVVKQPRPSLSFARHITTA
jgi:hypothetical protein